MTLKIKRIRIVRPEVQIEFKRPILGRIYFLFMLPKMIKIVKGKLIFAPAIKPVKVYFIGIPKIKVGGASD